MKVSLVHNPTAGDGQDVDQVVALLRDAGHRVRHRSSTDDWKALLQDPDDVLVAAGGDGTVRKVALAAAEHDLPFAIPDLRTFRVRRVQLTVPAGERLRVDDRLVPKDGRVADDADVELRVLPRAVRVLGGEDAG